MMADSPKMRQASTTRKRGARCRWRMRNSGKLAQQEPRCRRIRSQICKVTVANTKCREMLDSGRARHIFKPCRRMRHMRCARSDSFVWRERRRRVDDKSPHQISLYSWGHDSYTALGASVCDEYSPTTVHCRTFYMYSLLIPIRAFSTDGRTNVGTSLL
jgi:hypothetical protein